MCRATPAGRRSGTAKSTQGRGGPGLTSSPTWTLPSAGWSWYGITAAAGWPHPELRGDDHWPTSASPVRRLREAEVHHVDLGLGYEPSDWPEDYVTWELPVLLATVPNRAHRTDDVRDLVAWLSGRRPVPTAIELDPW